MSKERLEELIDGLPTTIKCYPDFELLEQFVREQAERAQELEELEQEYVELNNDFTKLALENKRYRKKIEVALDMSKKGSRDDIRVSNMQYVLNEALEESE